MSAASQSPTGMPAGAGGRARRTARGSAGSDGRVRDRRRAGRPRRGLGRASAGGSRPRAVVSAGSALLAGAAAFLAAAIGAGRRRLREATDGLLLPVPRPGRPRVPSGMISASATVASQRSRRRLRPARDRAVRRPGPGASEPGELGEAPARWCTSGSKPRTVAHPRGVEAAAVGEEADLLGREVRPRPAWRRPRPASSSAKPAPARSAGRAGGSPGTASARRRRRR